MSNTNTVLINGKQVIVETSYIGDKQWEVIGSGPIHGNHLNHEVVITGSDGTESLEIWGSIADPSCFEDRHAGPFEALVSFCREATDYLNEEVIDLLPEGASDSEYEELQSALADMYDKLVFVGLDADDIFFIANSEDNYREYNTDEGVVIEPLGWE